MKLDKTYKLEPKVRLPVVKILVSPAVIMVLWDRTLHQHRKVGGFLRQGESYSQFLWCRIIKTEPACSCEMSIDLYLSGGSQSVDREAPAVRRVFVMFL